MLPLANHCGQYLYYTPPPPPPPPHHKKDSYGPVEKGITTNKEFWNFIKPFLTNKLFSKYNDITLKNKK